MTFSGVSLALGSALEPLLGPTTGLVIAGCHIKPTFSHASQSKKKKMVLSCCTEEMTLQNHFFCLLTRHPLIKLFHLSNLLPMPNNQRTVDTEFLGNFSCSFKRISIDDPLNRLLSTSDSWPLHPSSSRLLCLLKNFLNYHCTVRSLAVPGPNVLLMLQVVSAAL